MFNANYANVSNWNNNSMMNAYYAQIRGQARREGYAGGVQGNYNGHSGGRNGMFNGRGMFLNSHPRGFPAGTGHFGNHGRNQMMIGSNRFGSSRRGSFGSTGFSGTANYEPAYMPHYSTNDDPWPVNSTGLQMLHSGHSCVSDYFGIPWAGVSSAAHCEGPADEGWYLDSGATHHLTNSMGNLNIIDEFRGNDKLIIGEGLSITHIGDSYFSFKGSKSQPADTHIALKDILLVPFITKNLISISKLTTNNNISVEFLGSFGVVKDLLKGQVLMLPTSSAGPSQYAAEAAPAQVHKEPDSVDEALQDTNWFTAMEITGPNNGELDNFIQQFNSVFALNDLGKLSYFLGIKVLYDQDCIYLSHKKYIRDLLAKVDMLDCKGVITPMCSGKDSKLQKIVKGELGCYIENDTHYRSIVGGLQYLILTRPEIAHSVHKLSQYVSAPTMQHLMACKRVLKYLKETQDYGLKFVKDGDMKITSFIDADWGSDLDDRKSIGVYCVYLGNNLISWSSKKQTVVTKSSTESEYRALASAASEIAWLKSLFLEMGVCCVERPTVWCDNMSAIELVKNPVFHSRTKHIEIDVHFIRDKVLAGNLKICYVPSEDQIADILTKPLSSPQFNYLRDKLNVFPCPLSLRGAVKIAHYAEVKKKNQPGVRPCIKSVKLPAIIRAMSEDPSQQ
ncbi:hypothetical protein KPL71_024275 [Citrus sinensis]|uniref:Uncharacterized protein n=1 Tax=Citrus sinensis TaxID=2711 RepID=A0ACB8IQT4_CITSI|nr:hypothetical protein KPL71_024275 [Citrus sinensis]